MVRSFSRLFLGRVEAIFLLLLLAAAGIIFAYQAIFVTPVQRCEASGNWWDPQMRVCGHVVYLPDITRRPLTGKAENGKTAATPLYPTLPATAAQAAAGTSRTR